MPMNHSAKPEPTALEKLQELLRTLFQSEFSELDFGIYRLFRLKQDELRAFIEKQLPDAVDKTFAGVEESDAKHLSTEVERLAERIRTEIDPNALLDNGTIKEEFRSIKAKAVKELVTEYETKRAKLDAVRVTEEQKLDVFNHLYNFFSRYYDACDFIPKRFYGARGHYAVPYNGEETHFHWANRDQHYVKTAEAFRDYAFTVQALGGPFRIRFVITSANVPKDNTKGDRRYFFPMPNEATYDKATKTLQLPFHYRLPTAAELKGGNENGNGDGAEEEKQKKLTGEKLQESLLQGALKDIFAKVKEVSLASALAEVMNREAVEKDGAEPVTLLLKRLRHFSRRNTTDYFIHKQLKKFLGDELEFYIKDQILHVGDLEGDFEGKRRMLRAFHQLADNLITFLAQIEDVQLRLFEKRKFVLRSDYLVTLAHVPKQLWEEILDSKRGAKQLHEWKRLYAFDDSAQLLDWKGKLNEAFLEKHPTIVINTANFDEAFKQRLLESFDDLDAVTDGVLVHAENYQASRLLDRKFRERIQFAYIDPPYNTGKDEFIYKDSYRHSSWLAMIRERLSVLYRLLAQDGSVAVSIDANEMSRLIDILDELFSPANHLGDVVWKNATDNNPTRVAVEHEYVLFYAKNMATSPAEWKSTLSQAKDLLMAKYEELKAAGLSPKEMKKPYQEFIKDNAELVGELERYKFIDKHGPYTGSESVHNPHPGGYDYDIPHPETGRSMRKPANGYRFPWETMKREYIDKKRLIYGPDEKRIVKIKVYLRDYLDSLRSVMHLDGRLGAYALNALFGTNDRVFDNPKPPQLISRLISFATPSLGWVLDPTTGSGTTAESVIWLNREARTSRRFLLIEMGRYFDSVILPRIQKLIFTPHWKDGRPVALASKGEMEYSPHFVKVVQVESYEDSLHNLGTNDSIKRSEPRAAAHSAHLGTDTYRLQYIARLPLEESASMLQMDKLEHPFAYSLEILTDDGPKVQTVDLIETFNYLLGLDVQRLEMWENAKDKHGGHPRRYRVVKGKDRGGKRFLIVWRDITDLDPKMEREFLEAHLKQEKEPFDRHLINGDSATPGFESLDALFKQLMTE